MYEQLLKQLDKKAILKLVTVSLQQTRMKQSQFIGKVYLVGAGPGDPGLLTIKAKGILELADVVIYDALVSPAILDMINPTAEKIDAGKRRGRHSLRQSETTQLLIEKAQDHAIVVRLKGAGVEKRWQTWWLRASRWK